MRSIDYFKAIRILPKKQGKESCFQYTASKPASSPGTFDLRDMGKLLGIGNNRAKMTPRAKYLCTLFVLFPIGFVALSCFAVWVLPLFALAILAWAVFIQIIGSRVRCPKCQLSVGWTDFCVLEIRLSWWTPLPKKNCSHCGFPLDRRESA